AIVISFSSWLPDSQQTLARDLFADIATEISKSYIVPGLRKRLIKTASMIAGAASYLKVLPEVFPPFTQRQEILELSGLLSRVPQRVVVLLDEIDRMQKDELLTLLKILRGAPALPNLTFLCAFDPEEFERRVCDDYDSHSHEFMEKFFPTAVDLPKPSIETLKRILQDRILESLDNADWFIHGAGRSEFTERFEKLSESTLLPVLTNLRKIGLLANDLHAAALLVRGEVDPLDLCMLEVVRRFYPEVYELIWQNPAVFCNSDRWWKSRRYQPDEKRKAQTQLLTSKIKAISEKGETGAAVYPLLLAMFPELDADLGGRPTRARGDTFSDEAEKARRISHPDYFPVYFLREVPEAVFSVSEMRGLTEELSLASSDEERRASLSRWFRRFEPNSIRRYDFIHKVGLELETLQIDLARSVAIAIATNSDTLGNDFFISEMRRAAAAVLAVAQRLAGAGSINAFIGECIDAANDDLFAAELYRSMTVSRDRNKVVTDFSRVRDSEISDAFAGRMNRQYGPGADIANVGVTSLHTFAFSL